MSNKMEEKTMKPAEVEAFLTKRLTELGVPPSKVTCPKDMEPTQGKKYECDAVIEGTSYTDVVTISKIDGNKVEYDNEWKRGEAVFRSKLQPAIEQLMSKEYGMPVTAACPEPLLFLDAQRNVTCELTAGTAKTKIAVAIDKDLNATSWSIDPKLVKSKVLADFLTNEVKAKSPTMTVSCGEAPLIARPADGKIDCTGTDGDKTVPVHAEVSPDLSQVRWLP